MSRMCTNGRPMVRVPLLVCLAPRPTPHQVQRPDCVRNDNMVDGRQRYGHVSSSRDTEAIAVRMESCRWTSHQSPRVGEQAAPHLRLKPPRPGAEDTSSLSSSVRCPHIVSAKAVHLGSRVDQALALSNRRYAVFCRKSSTPWQLRKRLAWCSASILAYDARCLFRGALDLASFLRHGVGSPLEVALA